MDDVTAKPFIYEPGMRVALRSGGPPMTVIDVGKHTGGVFCDWFDGDGEFRSGLFSAGSLTMNHGVWQEWQERGRTR